MQEKRKFARLQQTVNVKHRVQGAELSEYAVGDNISAGGVRLSTTHELNVGNKIELELHIPNNSRPFYAIGEVVWHKNTSGGKKGKCDIGIKFTKLVSRADLKGF